MWFGRKKKTGTTAKTATGKHASEVNAAIAELASKTHAIIRFDRNGIVLEANENFLAAMEYDLDDIVGQHHRIFVPQAQVDTPEYATFWERLAGGERFSDEFERVTKSGRQIWIDAVYAPITSADGNIDEVVKLAVDVTAKRSLEHLGVVLKGLGRGDLTTRFTVPREDSMYELAQTFNEGIGRISGAMSTVDVTTKSVLSGSSELRSVSNRKLTEAQSKAAGFENIAAEVNTVSELVAKTAERTSQIYATSEENQRLLSQTREKASQATDTMRELLESTEMMARANELIEDIAFQTNLLALNASVEAARAGEKGVGFAVVAEEVRHLAGRSADASKEIQGLIEKSSKYAETMAEQITKVDADLVVVSNKSGEMLSDMTAIRQGTEEQTSNVRSISSIVTDFASQLEEDAYSLQRFVSLASELADTSTSITSALEEFEIPDAKPLEVNKADTKTLATTGSENKAPKTRAEAPAKAPATKSPPKPKPVETSTPKPIEPAVKPASALGEPAAADSGTFMGIEDLPTEAETDALFGITDDAEAWSKAI